MTENPFDDDGDKPSEYKLHVACVKHIESCFIGTHNPNLKFWHVPNQTRDATEAFFNKQMGVLPGVLDLMFGWSPSKCGVWELKKPGEKPTASQKKFMSWADYIGWHSGWGTTVRHLHDGLISWGHKAAHNYIIEPDYQTEEKKKFDAFEFYKR